MKYLLGFTLAIILATTNSSFSQESDPAVDQEVRLYYACATKSADEYLSSNATATEVTEAALTSCDLHYFSVLDAQTNRLMKIAGSSIESQQMAKKWAKDLTDVNKKVIRDKTLQYVVSQRAKKS